MTRSSYLRAAALLSTAALAIACSSNSPANPAGSGTMAVRLTDAPFLTDSVQSVNPFVIRVDGRIADADSATAARGASDDSATVGGWTTLATPNSSVNLLAYQNGAALALGSATMPSGTYAGFRLVIDPTRSSIIMKNGTMLNGLSTPGVMFPSASRSGIKIVLARPVTVTADQTTTILVDFMVDSSFVMRGSTIMQNGLLFRPVIHGSMQ